MDITAWISLLINFVLIIAFIVDRVYRINSIKEYKQAKEEIVKAKDTQIEALQQHLVLMEKSNDIVLAEMHAKRVESMKAIVAEKEIEIEKSQKQLDGLKKELEAKGTTDSISKEQLLQVMELVSYVADMNVKTQKEITDSKFLSWNFTDRYYKYPIFSAGKILKSIDLSDENSKDSDDNKDEPGLDSETS